MSKSKSTKAAVHHPKHHRPKISNRPSAIEGLGICTAGLGDPKPIDLVEFKSRLQGIYDSVAGVRVLGSDGELGTRDSPPSNIQSVPKKAKRYGSQQIGTPMADGIFSI